MVDWKYEHEKIIEKDINLLFLDIGGVLNYLTQDGNNSYSGRFRTGEEIEPKLVKKLNKVFREIPNLKIVISSSWRGNMKKTIWALKFAGFEYVENIIGKTSSPYAVTEKHYRWETIKLEPPYTLLNSRRGEQILTWLIDNPGVSKKLNDFVILDDEGYDIVGSRGFNLLKPNFIKTQSNLGLSNTNVQSIINHLKGEKNETN